MPFFSWCFRASLLISFTLYIHFIAVVIIFFLCLSVLGICYPTDLIFVFGFTFPVYVFGSVRLCLLVKNNLDMFVFSY